MATISFKNVNKVYPNGFQAVYDFELDVRDREFIVFVGPSGCGKSTTLRMLAGLEEITTGEIYIDDILINDVPPKDRNIAMVFQSYALYPHMTVKENMSFGLRLRKTPKAEIEKKVDFAAKTLGLTQFLDRKPRALSGGQRQRVALGRAIVRDAKVFLMDEPLSNLDAKLRVQTRSELIKLHQRLETTTVYVTHDQIEAMTMASRIVVMKDGHMMQVGTPKEIYDYPNCVFVGGFIGTPPMNFIRGKIDNKGFFCTGDERDLSKYYRIKVPEGKLEYVKANDMMGEEIILGIRPEDIHDDELVAKTYPKSTIEITVDVAELLGAETHIYAEVGEATISASVDARYDVKMGQKMKLTLDMNKCHFFDPESEKVLKLDGNIKELHKVKKQLQMEKEAKEALERAEEERLKEEDPVAYQKLLIKKEKEQKRAEKEAKKAAKPKGERRGFFRWIYDMIKDSIVYNREKKAQKQKEYDLSVKEACEQIDVKNPVHKDFLQKEMNKKIFNTYDAEALKEYNEKKLKNLYDKFQNKGRIPEDYPLKDLTAKIEQEIAKEPSERNFVYEDKFLSLTRYELGEKILKETIKEIEKDRKEDKENK